MPTTERVLSRGRRTSQRLLLDIGGEMREARRRAGLSQARVAGVVGMSRPRYTKVEAGHVPTLQLREAALLGAVLGLDLVVRLYPGPDPLRDAASVRRLDALLAHVRPPLIARREVPLPARGGSPELRAWDAALVSAGERTCIELETRLRDIQATERRLALKRRDDSPDRFLLVVAATASNRHVLRDHPAAFVDLPRLPPSAIHQALEVGRHPPTGLVLL